MPEPASNPPIGQSPASPYTAGFTEPLVRRAAPARTVPATPAPVEPVSLMSPVPAQSPARPEADEDARLEEPSPTEPSPYEPGPTEPSPIEPSSYEPSSTEPSPYEPSPTEPSPTEPGPTEPELMEPSAPSSELAEPTADPDESEPEPLLAVSAAEDDIVVDAAGEEPVDTVTEPSRVRSIPMIQRAPEPSVTQDVSGAQAYTAPVDPSMWFIGPLEESQAPPFVRVRHHGPERVERGLLFAAIPLVLGCALSAALFHLGHIPLIVALAMAPAGALLYGKGAGARPQAGAVRLVALLVAGVLLAWPISLATELLFYYTATTGTSSGAIGYVVSNMFSASLFMAKIKELLLVALFGLGGVIAVVQTMVSTRRRRRSEAS